MSNYSKTTDFAAKDALSTGNANKIVKGTEIDDEFDAIQTAVNSKADTNNAALTGTPTAPTASAATNSTQIGTTAYITSAITTAVAAAKAALFPVGTIYTQAAVSTNPATLLGFGTWVSFGAGRVMVGIDGSDTAFDTLEETGGSAAVTPSGTGTNSGTALTEAQMPKHYHLMLGPNNVTSPQGSGSSSGVYGGGTPDDSTQAYGTYSTGGSAASGSQSTGTSNGNTHTHSFSFSGNSQTNLQPYIVVYMWKRTA